MENETNSVKDKMVGCPSLLTGMSHEMRTHMNAIVAFSYLMKDPGCNSNDRDDFSSRILSSCEQLIGLFDSFLDSAIIDTGKTKADLKISRLDNFLDELLPELYEELQKNGNNEIELVTETQYPDPVEVILDKNKVYRIIRSLFQNSVNNTRSGYIKIGYCLMNDRVEFYVLDSGQGYFKSREFLQTEDLNEAFSQHNDTYSAVNIALAKKLVGMLNGTIRVECNGLTGSGIYFSIPARLVSVSGLHIQKYSNTMIAI